MGVSLRRGVTIIACARARGSGDVTFAAAMLSGKNVLCTFDLYSIMQVLLEYSLAFAKSDTITTFL